MITITVCTQQHNLQVVFLVFLHNYLIFLEFYIYKNQKQVKIHKSILGLEKEIIVLLFGFFFFLFIIIVSFHYLVTHLKHFSSVTIVTTLSLPQ